MTVAAAVVLCVAGVMFVVLAPTLRTHMLQTMPSCYLQVRFLFYFICISSVLPQKLGARTGYTCPRAEACGSTSTCT